MSTFSNFEWRVSIYLIIYLVDYIVTLISEFIPLRIELSSYKSISLQI